jgi:hypothetical protein
MTSPTRYERTLANCARSLSDFIALKLEEQADDFWPTFWSWVRANRQAATKHAGAFVGQYMADKADNKTFDQSLGIHIASWKTFGVGVSLEVKDEINALTRDKLRPEKQTRLNALGARKSDQFDRLEQNWAKLIEYLGYTSGKRLRSIAGLRSPHSLHRSRARWRTFHASLWRSWSKLCCVRARSSRCFAVRE